MLELQYISEQFQQWEGRCLQAYIPCFVKPAAHVRVGKTTRNYTGSNGNPADYEVMGASGVTIGTGCDLGQQTYGGLLCMGVPAALISRFEPYFGKSGAAAILALYRAPFCITELECEALDRAIVADYVHRIARLYDGQSSVPFADIPREAQAVTAHLFYHKGSPRSYPKTWAALTRQDWQDAADKLRNGSLWAGPYDYGRASEGRLLTGIAGVN